MAAGQLAYCPVYLLAIWLFPPIGGKADCLFVLTWSCFLHAHMVSTGVVVLTQPMEHVITVYIMLYKRPGNSLTARSCSPGGLRVFSPLCVYGVDGGSGAQATCRER